MWSIFWLLPQLFAVITNFLSHDFLKQPMQRGSHMIQKMTLSRSCRCQVLCTFFSSSFFCWQSYNSEIWKLLLSLQGCLKASAEQAMQKFFNSYSLSTTLSFTPQLPIFGELISSILNKHKLGFITFHVIFYLFNLWIAIISYALHFVFWVIFQVLKWYSLCIYHWITQFQWQ